jgi:hypothetical protein
MACPLFIPHAPLGELIAIAPPLGDLYDGVCDADPAAPINPETLRRYCNFGYARGHCERAARADADAVRVLVTGEHFGIVDIAWSIERNHHPVAVGRFAVDTLAVDAGSLPTTKVPTLERQAQACAAAYARQSRTTVTSAGRIPAAAHP